MKLSRLRQLLDELPPGADDTEVVIEADNVYEIADVYVDTVDGDHCVIVTCLEDDEE